MSKIQVFAVEEIELDEADFSHVKTPRSGFNIAPDVDLALEALLEDPKLCQQIKKTAELAYTDFFMHTSAHLREFDTLFAGMLANGAASSAVDTLAASLKNTLEAEVPRWEKMAEHEVLEKLKSFAQKR